MNNAVGAWPPLDNPFATRWVTPGAIRFRFPSGDSLPLLWERIARHRRRAAIVGPHGTGKSTLIANLASHGQSNGIVVRVLRVRDKSRPSLPAILSATRFVSGGLLFVDGFEALATLMRRATFWASHYHQCGLVVSSHAATFLPTVIQTTSSPQLATYLAQRLWHDAQDRSLSGRSSVPHDHQSEFATTGFPLPPDRIDECYQQSAGNLREFFFALYDECERLRRRRRSSLEELAEVECKESPSSNDEAETRPGNWSLGMS